MILVLLPLLLACTDKVGVDDSAGPGDGGGEVDGGGTTDGGGSPDGGGEVDGGGIEVDGGGEADGGGSGDGGGVVEVDWALYTITGDLEQDTLTADGWSETTVTLTAVDAKGTPPPDGADLPLKTSRGTVIDIQPMVGGVATATVRSGTWPGEAALTVLATEISGESRITLVTGTPTSVQLHLHGSVSEGAGTMQSHTAEAERVGVDLLWWTDHDYSYYRDHSYELTGYDFETGSLTDQIVLWPATDVQDVVWTQVSNELDAVSSEVTADAAHGGSYGWRLSGSSSRSDGAEALYRILMTPRLNFKTLLSQVDMGFSIRPHVQAEGAEIFITVPLSGRRAGNDDQYEDPYHKLHFVWSQTEYESGEYDIYVPIEGELGEWIEVRADVSTLVEEGFPSEGLDLHAEFVDVRIRSANGQEVQVDLDDFTWNQVIVGEELMDVQRDYLASLDSPVQHLVGYELSYLTEGHLNAYGSDLGLLPYTDSETWTATEAVEWVRERGGLASLNHLFGVTGVVYDEVERLALIDEKTDEILANEAYRCEIIEVGYRKRGGETQDFLTVWDNLGMAGLYITGEGSSDLHGKQPWDTNENNFVTWVVGGSPSEEELIHNLRRGSAFFGDASVFEGGDVEVELVASGYEASMGQVVEGATGKVRVRFTAQPLDVGWLVRAVEDGTVVDEWTVAEGETRFERTVTIAPEGGKLIRFEVWTRDPAEAGKGLLFTNPIYFVDAGLTVPAERVPIP